MTSMPASRRMRATTLTPRSCPSRPTLATRTRNGRSFSPPIVLMGWCSQRSRLGPGPEDTLEGVDDLALGRVDTDGVDERGHEVDRRIDGFGRDASQRA